MTERRRKMVETQGSGHAGSTGSRGDASARMGSIGSGHAEPICSIASVQARAASVPRGSACGSVSSVGSVS
jgi:hypothetical protein